MPGNSQSTAIKKGIRLSLIVLGTIFLGLGIIGIFVPVLPTTPFVLASAVCYARSSQRLYNWLLNNRWFGKYIRNYLQKKGIPLKTKILAISLLWIAIGLSAAFVVESLVIRVVLIVIALGVTIHLLSIRTFKEQD